MSTVESAKNQDPSLYCEILGRSFSEDTIPEWVHGADGQPCCTQFVPKGQPLPTPRCEHTADMFDTRTAHPPAQE